MTTFAVLATGASMSQALADRLKTRRRIVVNDAFRLAPDAEALAANDQAWWRKHTDALAFAGRKFSTTPPPRTRVERVEPGGLVNSGSNSALLALHVAVTILKATRVELYGVDLKGTHYFGPHVGLSNTRPERFEVFKMQFERYARSLPNGVEVVNCNPESELRAFPFAELVE